MKNYLEEGNSVPIEVEVGKGMEAEGKSKVEEGKLKEEEDKHLEMEEDTQIVDGMEAAVNGMGKPGEEEAQRQTVEEVDKQMAEAMHIHMESFVNETRAKPHMAVLRAHGLS
ncbi:unnamed protein product [Rhodiola kirilowii]